MSDEICLTNLGPRGRRARWLVAGAMGVVCVGVLVVLLTKQATGPWRLAIFPPLFAGALGFFQAAAGT